MGLLGDISGTFLGAINTGYNLYTNKRDFDYQKALQQQIFEREDTAVQRRVEDLKAAGLNPALANGSAASAGSVVSRSNTNDVNFGSALDMINAVNHLKQQEQQTENLKKESDLLDQKSSEQAINNTLSKMYLFNQLGLNYGVMPKVKKDGTLDLNFQFAKDDIAYKNNMPFYQLFDYQNSNLKNSADLLQKQVDWYNVNQISDLVFQSLGTIINGVNAGAGVYKSLYKPIWNLKMIR